MKKEKKTSAYIYKKNNEFRFFLTIGFKSCADYIKKCEIQNSCPIKTQSVSQTPCILKTFEIDLLIRCQSNIYNVKIQFFGIFEVQC